MLKNQDITIRELEAKLEEYDDNSTPRSLHTLRSMRNFNCLSYLPVPLVETALEAKVAAFRAQLEVHPLIFSAAHTQRLPSLPITAG